MNRNAAILLCVALLQALKTSALIQAGRGNDPVHDHSWPQGALSVANLKSRVCRWEGPPFGGGQWQFLYKLFTVGLTKLAHLGGVVTDTHGKPLRNVKVRASSVMAMDGRGYRQPSSQQSVTDEAGRFELAGLPGGFLQLHASAPGARATVKVVYE